MQLCIRPVSARRLFLLALNAKVALDPRLISSVGSWPCMQIQAWQNRGLILFAITPLVPCATFQAMEGLLRFVFSKVA